MDFILNENSNSAVKIVNKPDVKEINLFQSQLFFLNGLGKIIYLFYFTLFSCWGVVKHSFILYIYLPFYLVVMVSFVKSVGVFTNTPRYSFQLEV